MLFEYGLDPVYQQYLFRARLFQAVAVMIKFAPVDFHHLTKSGDGIGLLLLPDEVVSQFDSFAKKAAVFLRFHVPYCLSANTAQAVCFPFSVGGSQLPNLCG